MGFFWDFMKYIHHRPDYLRLNPAIRRDLEVLANYKTKRRLKVTDEGFTLVSRTHALFQHIKGLLGFANYCSKAQVFYHAQRLQYEVTIAGTEKFSREIKSIKENLHLAKIQKKVALLFRNENVDLDDYKNALMNDHQKLDFGFWKRLFKMIPPFYQRDFGTASLNLPYSAPSFSEGIEIFSNVLKMEPTDAVISREFNRNFCDYLRNKHIPQELIPRIAEIRLRIATAHYYSQKVVDSIEAFQAILRDCDVTKWPPLLVESCFQALIECRNGTEFIALYRKAVQAGFPRGEFRSHFLDLALRHGQHLLLDLDFEEAPPQEITKEFAEELINSGKNAKEELKNYFRLRQKAPVSVVELEAPWHYFKTSAEVRDCEDCCQTREDRDDLERVFRDRNVQEANGQLQSISMVDRIFFQRKRSKVKDALERFRETFKEAKANEYDASWLSPYLDLLVKKDLHEEIDQVVNKTLVICRAQKKGIDLLKLVLPYVHLKHVVDHGEGLAAFLVRSPLRIPEKLALVDAILRKGPHPHLYFLKGEWVIQPQERLRAYQAAYSYAPVALFIDKPLEERELLADEKATIADIPTYRKIAIQAGCQPANLH